MLPYTSDRLTPVEQAVQREQERRDCMTCSNAQRQPRSGARVCVEPEAPDTRDVLAGLVICDWWC